MKHKVLVTLLAVLLLVSLSIPVSADQYLQSEIPSELKGYATDNEGNTVEIIGRLVDTVAPRSIDGTYASTYAYDITMTTTAEGPDSGYASYVYLTVHYTKRDGSYYLLNAVSGSWEIHDYNVTVTSSTISYSCHPYEHAYNVPVSNGFYKATGFTLFTTDDGSFSTVGATLYLTYQMGSSRTWTFALPNNVYG